MADLSSDQLAHFVQRGFLQVPGALSRAQAGELRQTVEALFAQPSAHPDDGPKGREDLFCRYPELRWLLAHPPIVGALRSLLGDDFLYVHEATAHRDRYAGWHKDTTSQERRGHDFHWQPGFAMVQCAIYLQDNTSAGGGLSVLPGSHITPDRYMPFADFPSDDPRDTPRGWGDVEPITRRLLEHLPGGGHAERIGKRLLQRLGRRVGVPPPVHSGIREHAICSQLGDLVMFDMRLDHRGTPSAPGAALEKLALFFIVGRNDAYTRRYAQWQRERTDYTWFDGHPDFDPELKAYCAEHGLHLIEPQPSP